MPSSASAPPPSYILPAIVVSQFAGTALWFAGNAVLPDLVDEWGLEESSLSYLTSAVQLGFIIGTLIFAGLNLADRFSPTRLFMTSAITGATMNALIPVLDRQQSVLGLVVLRFATGVTLAGVYPVGMKVAADWFPPASGGLGKALGFLVGALALGSAFPFLLRRISQPWQALLWETSALAATGGLLVGFGVPNGPHRKAGAKWEPSVLFTLFESPAFRGAAFGYFGHMWELYAFWTWCPVVWEAYLSTSTAESVSWDEGAITFFVLAMGGVGCVVGGLVSVRYGSAVVAFGSLAVSGLLCVISPLLFMTPPIVTLLVYLLWGMAVAADSPQFSSLVAQYAPSESKGTALTIVNCIGFAITIGSIQLLGVPLDERYLFLLLAPGPFLGLISMRKHVFGGHADESAEGNDEQGSVKAYSKEHDETGQLEMEDELIEEA